MSGSQTQASCLSRPERKLCTKFHCNPMSGFVKPCRLSERYLSVMLICIRVDLLKEILKKVENRLTVTCDISE